ncbi:MAG: response regulator [Deltaproteobacteria bacterium]|nr:response regulator [Deltaproteobacteria bacterium]
MNETKRSAKRSVKDSVLREIRNSVLIVEDNQIVAQIEEEVIKSLGVDVFVARTGPEAVDIFIENMNKISVVILDFAIPGMHASQLVARLRGLKENLKLILASGYQEQDIFADLSPHDVDGFIPKPFEIRTFVLMLNEAIQETRQ